MGCWLKIQQGKRLAKPKDLYRRVAMHLHAQITKNSLLDLRRNRNNEEVLITFFVICSMNAWNAVLYSYLLAPTQHLCVRGLNTRFTSKTDYLTIVKYTLCSRPQLLSHCMLVKHEARVLCNGLMGGLSPKYEPHNGSFLLIANNLTQSLSALWWLCDLHPILLPCMMTSTDNCSQCSSWTKGSTRVSRPSTITTNW